MEQELIIIKFIIYGMVGLTGIFIIIFSLRKDNNNSIDWAMVDKYYEMMQEETKDNLDTLNKLNREKDRLEKQIRKKKKILGKDLVRKR